MKRSRLLFACAALVATASLTACGTDTDRDDNGNGSAVPIEQVSEALVDLVCERIINCCDGGQFQFDTQADCVTQFGAQVRSGFDVQVDSVQEGRQTYDGVLAGSCLNLMQTASCEDGILPINGDGCETVFRPTVAVGGRCLASDDCLSGICSATDGDTEGVCGQAAIDETCPNDCELQDGVMVCFETCGDSLTCSFPDQICVERAVAAGVGESCSDMLCEDELFCNSEQICEARRANGAQCESDNECENFDCDGTTCSTSTCSF